MTALRVDQTSSNPRIQCTACGRWMRLYQRDRRPPFDSRQLFFGGCHHNNGDDHLAGSAGSDVCVDCCERECFRLATLRGEDG